MTLTQAIELLENATARNFSSRNALIDACNQMAEKILVSTPISRRDGPDTYQLPRGYRAVWTSHWYAQQELHSQVLVHAQSGCAVNHTALRHCGDDYEDAPRRVLLAFAKDCATGLLEEIAAQLEAAATENEQATKLLAGVR